MLRYLFISLVTVILVTAVVSAEDGDGGYAGAFLQVPIGARPTAMGGAYLGVSNDGAGALFNPAGLANLQSRLFATSYRVMQLDRKLGYITAMFPIQNQAVLGFHWLYAGSGSVTMRDFNGRPLDAEFSQNNHAFAALFAKRFEKYFSLGVKLNYYHATIPEVTASSVGFDCGILFYLDELLLDREQRFDFPLQNIQAGLTIKNLGMKYPWNSQKFNTKYRGDSRGFEQDDEVPLEIGLGGSARMIKSKLLLAADVVKNEEQGAVFRGGSEFLITPEFAIRGGYGDKRFTAGTGYVFKFGKQLLAIDYAFSTDKADEGSEHIFSFDLLF